MKRVVFMGSKPIGYKCFEYLLINKKSLHIDITGLFTNNRKEFGEGNDLSALAKINNISVFSDLNEILKLDDIDILISVQYHKILKRQHILKAKQIAINLHMAPLPEYRGSNQFSFAILNGDKIFGTTIHKLEESIDGGPIIFEERFDINPSLTVKELYDITFEKSFELFSNNIDKIINGNFKLINQKTLYDIRKNSFHLRKEIDEIKKIQLSWDEITIDRHLRATSMPGFEPPFTIINDKKVYLVTEYMYEKMKGR